MGTALEKELVNWVEKELHEDIIFDPREGYYSFDAIEKAYAKGKKQGVESLKKDLMNKHKDHTKIVSKELSDFLKSMAKFGYNPQKLFISHSLSSTKVIICVDEIIHDQDEFIDYAYSNAVDIQNELRIKDINIDISFMDSDESIDYDLLKEDGFDFMYDIQSEKEI